jgi:hypothetical protein
MKNYLFIILLIPSYVFSQDTLNGRVLATYGKTNVVDTLQSSNFRHVPDHARPIKLGNYTLYRICYFCDELCLNCPNCRTAKYDSVRPYPYSYFPNGNGNRVDNTGRLIYKQGFSPKQLEPVELFNQYRETKKNENK